MKTIEILVVKSQSTYIEVEVDEQLSDAKAFQQALKDAPAVLKADEDVEFNIEGSLHYHIKEENVAEIEGLKTIRFKNARKALELAFEDDNFTKAEMVEFLQEQLNNI